MYVPVAMIVPTVALPPTMPSTSHVTVGSVAFTTVAVNRWVEWVCMLDVAGETMTLIGAQPSAMAVPGVLVAAVGVTTTSARSMRPASSVTASRIVNPPLAGTSTTAMAGSVAVKLPEPHGSDQLYATMLRPATARLASPESSTDAPGKNTPLTVNPATGRSAASTAPAAFAIPAPQVSVVGMSRCSSLVTRRKAFHPLETRDV